MNADFWKAVAIRAIRTFAEGMLGALGTTVAGVTEMDWIGAASVGASAAIISVLIALKGLPEVPNKALPEGEPEGEPEDVAEDVAE